MSQFFCIGTERHYGLNPTAFLDLLEVSICRFPLLPLPRYVQGLANVVTSHGKKNETFSTQIEHLIDGMDLDEEWCRKYLDGPAEVYVRNKSTSTAKKNRVGSHPKYEGKLTTFIHDERGRQTALRVIGRTMEYLGKNFTDRPISPDLNPLFPGIPTSSNGESSSIVQKSFSCSTQVVLFLSRL